MTLKRFTALFLVLAMMLCLLTGCGRGRDDDKTTDRPARPTVSQQDEPSTPKIKPNIKSGREMTSEEVAEYLQTRVVTVSTDKGTGSAFFIDDEGTLVTNYHVIEAADSIEIISYDGARYEVKTIVDFSPFHDVAVLKIDVSGNDYLNISTEYKQGATVYAMGSPRSYEGTFTSGILSATSRQMGLQDCIQIDAAINPGNSGGPTVNSRGEVLAINTRMRNDSQNIGFAVKMSVLDELGMDKNYTMNRFREWYATEVGRSYMSTDGRGYYDTYVNTYTAVTGVECLFSTDDGEYGEEGYCIKYDMYAYEYDMENYDKYRDYLYSIGFEFVDDAREMGLDGQIYTHPLEGYTVVLGHETTKDILVVTCPMY